MKKCLFVFFVAISIMSCTKKQEGFTIKGHIAGFDNGYLVVMPNTPGYKMGSDTVEVVDGKFEYRGKVESPTFMWMLPTTDDPEFFGGSFNLFVGNEEISVVGDIKNFRKRGDRGKTTVTGSASHNEYLRLDELFGGLTPGETAKYVELILKDTNFATNQIMPYYIYTYTMKEDIAEREKYLSQLDKSLDNNIYVVSLRETLENEKKITIGSTAPDFTLKDIDGKEYKLSDFRGKYVLFEFSASWCSWCKKEIPYLQQVYDFGKEKEFVMFTINLDKTKELWESEVKKSEVPWMQLSDLQAMDGGVAKQYNISGIPQIFFIDKEGRIINNDLRGDEMINFVKETLNKQ